MIFKLPSEFQNVETWIVLIICAIGNETSHTILCARLLLFIDFSIAVDCGDLDDPDYGDVDISSTTYGSEATYTCRHGYYLVGNATRVCLYSGKWGGYAPVCKRKYSA